MENVCELVGNDSEMLPNVFPGRLGHNMFLGMEC